MALNKPSSQQIHNWIAGSLNAEESRVIELYFEQHPELLPDSEIPPLLKEAAQTKEADFSELLTTLKEQFSPAKTEPSSNHFLDLLSATHTPDLLGRLSDLEVHKVLSTTGMATVLKAHDAANDRWVAVKILSPAIATNAQARERFLREARAMAQLDHDAILPVYRIETASTPWFVMRYVSGGTLQDALDRKEEFLKTPEFITRLATKVAQALSVAHREGLIHRDIKPANILLSSDRSQIWLSDFGIAKATDDPSLTYGQALSGTPRYMSPEQANCSPLDSRSDTFSLGAVLYHCATGEAPFHGDSSTQVLHQIASQEPVPLKKFQTGLPSWLSQLVTDCLQKDPADRPDLLSALQTRTVRRDFSVLKKAALIVLPLVLLSLIATWTINRDQNNKLAQEFSNEITVPATGKSFSSLAQAIHQSPPNSRLLLSGTILVNERIATPPGTGLHLESAPGKNARVIIQNLLTGFEIGGNLKLKGIHFEHYGPAGEKLTVLARDAEFVTVSDCSFYSDAKTHTDSAPLWALQAQAITKTTIERCTFQGQTMGAIVLYDAKHTRPFRYGDLTITDCLLDCSSAILLRSRSPDSEFDIIGERVIFRGNSFLSNSQHNDFRPTRLTLRDSLIDTTEAVILDTRGHLLLSGKRLAVTSENSLYDGPTGALVVTGKKAAIENLTAIDEARSALFGEKQLLRESLPPDLSHPALKTFQAAPKPLSSFKFIRKKR